MASSSSLFSPRTMASSGSNNSLHRPWEQEKAELASSFSFSAPATPSTAYSQYMPNMIFTSSSSPNPHQHHRNVPGTTTAPSTYPHHLLHHTTFSSSGMMSPLSPFPGHFLMPMSPAAGVNGISIGSSSSGSSGGINGDISLSQAVHLHQALSVPSSPLGLPAHGSPFSPFPPWSAPYSLQSFPLPGMPFNLPRTPTPSSSSHTTTNSHPPKITTNGTGATSTITASAPSGDCGQNTYRSPVNASSSHNGQKSSPPKKKRKPPPIQIDSSISNFSGEIQPAHHHMTTTPSMVSPSMLGAYGLLSPTALMSAGSSLPSPSPLLSAQFHLQQQMMGYGYDGGALMSPLMSSGYGSVESQMCWPVVNFAFLCFLPGTKLKLLSGTDSPSRCEWQPAESFRMDNCKADFSHGFRLVSYVRSDYESANSVEMTLKPVETSTGDVMDASAGTSVRALCCQFHPFYDYQKGWVSLDPQSTREVYGISCQVLRVNDIVAVHPPERIDNAWAASMDLNATNVLAEWAARNRRAMSLDSANESRGWSQATVTSPVTPRETKVRVKKEKKEKKDDKAKRPMNAFMLFAQRYRVLYTQRYPGRDNRAISCLLGEHWKSLDMLERQKYTDEAKLLAEMYKEKNPDCWKRRSRSRSDSDVQLLSLEGQGQTNGTSVPVLQNANGHVPDLDRDENSASFLNGPVKSEPGSL